MSTDVQQAPPNLIIKGLYNMQMGVIMRLMIEGVAWGVLLMLEQQWVRLNNYFITFI